MAIDARHRSSIYEKLIPVLGEEDANVLMSEFPSVEADELVTKQFLRAEIADVRTELATFRGEVRTEIAELRTDLTVRMVAIMGSFTGAATALLGILISSQ